MPYLFSVMLHPIGQVCEAVGGGNGYGRVGVGETSAVEPPVDDEIRACS